MSLAAVSASLTESFCSLIAFVGANIFSAMGDKCRFLPRLKLAVLGGVSLHTLFFGFAFDFAFAFAFAFAFPLAAADGFLLPCLIGAGGWATDSSTAFLTNQGF